jgi:hypothetical protein
VKVIWIAALGLALSGCGSGEWVKPGGGGSQADFDECKYEAEKAIAVVRDPFERAFRKQELMESCLRLRGYSPR